MVMFHIAGLCALRGAFRAFAFPRKRILNTVYHKRRANAICFPPAAHFFPTRESMNILHTSDWHIGKRLMDRERLPEQEQALEEIARICEERSVELVLVAGDVFDTYMPSAEAEEVFFRAVKRIAGEERAVVIVSGNHDDGVRLAASAPLAAEEGIYLFGNGGNAAISGGDRPVRAVEAGEGYLVMENARGERVYLNLLPYPNEARLKEEKTEEGYADKLRRWLERGEAGYRGGMAHILLSHLFVTGGKVSESERDIDLGGARAVPLSLFAPFDYVALGHLHKPQKLGERVRYSGSILQYSFDESEQKQVVLLHTDGQNITAEDILLTSGKRLVRLEERDVARAVQLLKAYEGAFIELTLHLAAPLTSSETQQLRAANEGLVSLIVRTQGAAAATVVSRSTLSPGELFAQYYRSVYGDDPAADLTQAFLELLEEGV